MTHTLKTPITNSSIMQIQYIQQQSLQPVTPNTQE